MIKGIIFDFNRTLFDPDQSKFIDGLDGLLKKLKTNYRLGLISTGENERAKLINDWPLSSCFDFLKIAPNGKDESMFITFCRQFDIHPNEVIVVGDSIGDEILIGNKLKMITVRVLAGKFAGLKPGNKFEIPDFNIISVLELDEKVLKYLQLERKIHG